LAPQRPGGCIRTLGYLALAQARGRAYEGEKI